MLLRFLLGKYIRRGALSITTAKGTRFTIGDGVGEPVAVRIMTSSAERRLLFNPELALGEIFMDGSLMLEQGTIADLLAIALGQPDLLPRWTKLRRWLRYLIRHIRRPNPRGRSRKNVEHHYDLDSRLYALMVVTVGRKIISAGPVRACPTRLANEPIPI
jgi:cyclopropane-fatty-acyl-phospholipid synthase